MAEPARAELHREIRGLHQRIAQLEARSADQETRSQHLTHLLEQARRTAKRQAAPFSKGEPKPAPRPPGRKPGPDYGAPSCRSVPPPRKIDEVHDAPLPPQCLNGGGRLHEMHVIHQYQVEIPPRPIDRQFNVHVGQCTCCGRRVQGRHELQTFDVLGAAASQRGPDQQAAIVQLNKDAGRSHGRIQRLFQSPFGVELSSGGSVQAMLRAARRCQPLYGAIIRALPRQTAITPDETGWRIGGRLARTRVDAADARVA